MFHLRIIVGTLMNRSKVLQELSLYWQETWGRFQLGVWSISSIPRKFYWFVLFSIVLICIVFCICILLYYFKMLFWTEEKEAHFLFEKFINLFFLFFIFGNIFRASIMFECYHFQSKYDPDWLVLVHVTVEHLSSLK